MSILTDPERAQTVGKLLFDAWNSNGVLGERSMPEDILPKGVERGSSQHALFITLTVALDFMRDADQLWNASRELFADPATRYLFDPAHVVALDPDKVRSDLAASGVAMRKNNDPEVWMKICGKLHTGFQDRVEKLLVKGAWSGPQILKLIRSANFRDGFPNLKGKVIGPVWLRMLKDTWRGHEIINMDRVDLPVNEHVAAATVMTGCIKGSYDGKSERLEQAVQGVWREACEVIGLYPLQLDQSLWTLSRNGCRKTQAMPCQFWRRCPVSAYCTETRLNVAGSDGEGNDTVSFKTGKW